MPINVCEINQSMSGLYIHALNPKLPEIWTPKEHHVFIVSLDETAGFSGNLVNKLVYRISNE